MSGDRIVATLGLVMALTIVLGGNRLRGMKSGQIVRMGLIWLAIIVGAALLFRGFRQ